MRHPPPFNVRTALLATMALGLSACGQAGAGLTRDDASSSPCYDFLRDTSIDGAGLAHALESLPYDRISKVQYDSWSFGGPRVHFYRSGRAVLEEKMTVKEGEISPWDYGHLCQLLDELSFETCQQKYSSGVFDAGTTTIRIWRTGATEPMSVQDYGGMGPLRFWTMQCAIDGVASQVRWKDIDASQAPVDSDASPR